MPVEHRNPISVFMSLVYPFVYNPNAKIGLYFRITKFFGGNFKNILLFPSHSSLIR